MNNQTKSQEIIQAHEEMLAEVKNLKKLPTRNSHKKILDMIDEKERMLK